MWKKLKNSKLFLSQAEEHEIYVTDYVTLWCTFLSKKSFLSSLKSSNILLEMSDEALLQKGTHMLSNPGGLKSVDMKLEGKTLVLNLSMSFGYPFKLTLSLNEGSKELFFQKITQPLMGTISELKESQLELCQLLQKKDSEIEEYKCEGGEIALKHLKTKPFNKEIFLSKYIAFKELFGETNEILQDLTHMVLKAPEDMKNVKTEIIEDTGTSELQKIKVEPYVQPSTEGSSIKVEADSTNLLIKMEPNSQVSESQSDVTSAPNVQQYSQTSNKRESQSVSPRKKMKKLNL